MGPGGPMGPGVPMYGPMRGPPPGGPMPPISSMGPGGPRPPWHPGGPGPMSPYHHHSPGYVGPPPGPGPGTPIMASPSGPASEGDPLYMMKNVPMSGVSEEELLLDQIFNFIFLIRKVDQGAVVEKEDLR